MRPWPPLLSFIAGSACSASPSTPPPAPPPPAPSTTAEIAASAPPPASAAPDPDPLAGPLTPDAIKSIIRAHFGQFRLCFENNLRTSPNLQNRVAVQFVIGR